MKARTAAVAVALTAIVAAGACTQEIKQEIARDRQLDKDLAAVTAAGVPGVALVIRDGGDKTRIAAGTANVAAGRPMKVDDQIRIGSVSKTYVAVVVMQLVAEGKLNLDTTTVQQHLPGIVPNAAAITVRQLLNHSSGVANYEEHAEYLKQLMGNPDHVWTPRQLVDMGVALGPKFAPGTAAEHSNTNYTLLGLMIEKVTGEPLARQFDRRIFGPLGQKASSAPAGPDLSGQFAHGYFVFEQPPGTDVTHFSPSIGCSGGGIVSTVSEVGDFYQAVFAGRLVKPEHLAEMMTTVTGTKGEKHGLGLVPRDLPCGTVWGHSGNFPGYMTESYVRPGGTYQVTVPYNLDPNSMSLAAKESVRALFTHAFCGVN